jgi:hypothetical protein
MTAGIQRKYCHAFFHDFNDGKRPLSPFIDNEEKFDAEEENCRKKKRWQRENGDGPLIPLSFALKGKGLGRSSISPEIGKSTRRSPAINQPATRNDAFFIEE